ncbi:[citrate (pro-3S)-lyase] ligase [Periweissella fabalis]|uniref:[Citrate [pro-3S]-lyase] ligase n=1 Tax=Periweissella fabalis TaxID=1070421 RepID=A0A7X6N1B7_9LACO|nr:[citrate (pro-3S)-lyase] ligase [Periweissella fabalis]MCM0599173.1 [citrate (pro-3S)-lyase] ligase [Periweissella fabalis]NKZ23452.1 [citrate (pro-3S)-lyase] ligase [Periweissella fabalis]
MDTIRELYLTDKVSQKNWQTFLMARGISNFNQQEVASIDQTIGLYNEENQLVGTGSIAKNVIKFVAVCDIGAVAKGARFNQLISELTSRLGAQGIFHQFVFTKPAYVTSFKHVGFQALGVTELGAILEKGLPNIKDYLNQIPKFPNAKKVAGIVMNANPFTKGHRYLVEQAAKDNEVVYLFVVNADVSLFSTTERLELVRQGTSDLTNVIVVNGQDYLVSFISFPAYFIKDNDAIIRYQTELDASIFKQQIAPALGITARYLGSEPLSHTTNIYNESLQRILSPDITVKILKRATWDTQIISASYVRQLIKVGDVSTLAAMVPATTLTFIQNNLATLQLRISKGQNINGN